MGAGLMLGLVAVATLAASAPAEAKGRHGGFLFSSRSHAAPAQAPAAPVEAPRLRVAAADPGGPEPMTTGTAAVPRREAAPAPAPVPARPWCTGRVFGSGSGFCEIN